MGKTTARSRSSRRALVLGVASAIVLALAPVPGGSFARAAAPSLRWKFKAGETLRYQIDQKTATEVKTNGQNIKTTVTQSLETTWAVKSVDASGSAEMTQTIDRVKTKIESPFGAFEYDSRENKPLEGGIAAGIVPMLKVLVGATFPYKINPQGELSDVKVPEGLLKAMKEAGPASAQGPGMFTEDGLKNMIHESILSLPRETDKPWTRKDKIPSPPIGTLVLDKTYKYEGAEGNKEKIGMDVKVHLDPDPASNFEIKIVSQQGKGTFFFDNAAGRVVNSDVSEKVEMLITLMNTQINQSTDTSTSMKLLPTGGGASK